MATAIDKELQARIENMQRADTEIDNYPTWDYKKDPPLYGDVQKIKQASVVRRGKSEETRLAIVTNETGTYTLWESAALEDFFNKLELGMFVYIAYEGMEELPNGNRYKKFDARFV
mgnify:CR=1 FL=1